MTADVSEHARPPERPLEADIRHVPFDRMGRAAYLFEIH